MPDDMSTTSSSSRSYTKLDKPEKSDGKEVTDKGFGWMLPLFALGMFRYMSATSNIIHDCDEVFNTGSLCTTCSTNLGSKLGSTGPISLSLSLSLSRVCVGIHADSYLVVVLSLQEAVAILMELRSFQRNRL